MSNPPNCNCVPPTPAASFTVKKEGPTQGKQFYTCRSRVCKFFQWIDDPSNPHNNPSAYPPAQGQKRKLPASFTPAAQQPPQKQWKGKGYGKYNYEGRGGYGSSYASSSSSSSAATITTTEIHLSLAGKDSFAARVNKFVDKEFQKIPGYRYDLKTRLWTYPLSSYSDFLRHFRSIPGFMVEALSPSLLEIAQGSHAKDQMNQNALEETLKKNLPAKLLGKLMGFQKEGIIAGLRLDGRVLIGDEMGLGKTVQALGLAKIYQSEWPVLVVCPSSLRFTWAKEIENWLEIRQDDIDVILHSRQSPRKTSVFCIVSYDLMSRGDHLIDFPYKVIIADESHYLKSRDSKRSKAVCAMLKNAKRAILLSGTPAMSRPMELFPQLNALKKDLFPSHHQFGVRYCNAYEGKFGWDYRGSGNLPELHMMLTSTALIRRLKSEVLTQLPDKRRQVVYIRPDPKALREIELARAELRRLQKTSDLVDEDLEFFSMTRSQESGKHSLMIKMYHETATAKLAAVLEYLEDVFEDEETKVIVFAHHQVCLNGIADFLKKKNIDHIRIDGNSAQTTRQSMCDQFQDVPTCRVALLGITSASVGLTLTKANLVIFAELHWTPAQLLQGEDRAHRIGQKDCVDVKYLLAEGTIDEQLWPILNKKLEIVGESIDGTKGRMDSDDPKRPKPAAVEAPSSSSSSSASGTSGKTISDFFKPVGQQPPPPSHQPTQSTQPKQPQRQSVAVIALDDESDDGIDDDEREEESEEKGDKSYKESDDDESDNESESESDDDKSYKESDGESESESEDEFPLDPLPADFLANVDKIEEEAVASLSQGKRPPESPLSSQETLPPQSPKPAEECEESQSTQPSVPFPQTEGALATQPLLDEFDEFDALLQDEEDKLIQADGGEG